MYKTENYKYVQQWTNIYVYNGKIQVYATINKKCMYKTENTDIYNNKQKYMCKNWFKWIIPLMIRK